MINPVQVSAAAERGILLLLLCWHSESLENSSGWTLNSLCQVSVQPEQFLVPVHYVGAQTIVLDKSEGANEQQQYEEGPFSGSTNLYAIKLKPLLLHFMLSCLPVKGFITNFMFMTVKRLNCCKLCSWKWFRSFTSSYGFGVIFLFFSRPRHGTPDKLNKPFIVPVDMASMYFRPENAVMWVAVPWFSPFQGSQTLLCLFPGLFMDCPTKVISQGVQRTLKWRCEKHCGKILQRRRVF